MDKEKNEVFDGKENIEKPLSQRIREARISLNLSQRAFAKLIGITQAQLSRLENASAKKPNRRTLQALLPYLDHISYGDLLAMAGYSEDLTETADEDKELEEYEHDELAEEFKIINPELFAAAQDLYKYLDEPKNMILLQKVFELIKQIGMEGGENNELTKKKYLRDCILNLLQ